MNPANFSALFREIKFAVSLVVLLTSISLGKDAIKWEEVRLRGWGPPSTVFDKDGAPTHNIQTEPTLSKLIQDEQGRLWLFWVFQGLAWAASSSDGVKWTAPQSFPAGFKYPVNAMSVAYVQGGHFYFVIGSPHDQTEYLYGFTSDGMSVFSAPKLIESNAYRPSLVKGPRGDFLLYFAPHFYGGENVPLRLGKAARFGEWGPPETVMSMKNAFFVEAASSKSGRLWTLWLIYPAESKRGYYCVSSSDDGTSWSPCHQVIPSYLPEEFQSTHSESASITGTPDGKILVTFMQSARPVFCSSSDGLTWSPPGGSPLPFNRQLSLGPALFQRVLPIQLFDGRFIVAYRASVKTWRIDVAPIQDPFSLILVDGKGVDLDEEMEDLWKRSLRE